jgi:hypothetical protein
MVFVGSSFEASAPNEVEYFYAHQVTTGIELTWMAVSEYDIDGFRIYRREQNVPHYLLVNDSGMIRSWQHVYLDGSSKRGRTYMYVLGVVHEDGSEHLSYPVEVTTTAKRAQR